MAILLVSPAVLVGDGLPSIPAGGLIPLGKTGVAIAKEVIRISPKKVVVDDAFYNDSDRPVTIEIAFPVPPYYEDIDTPPIPSQSFADFKLYIEGKPASFKKKVRATLGEKGKDITEILTADKIDIPSFGHLGEANHRTVAPDIERLPKAEQERLKAMGLIGSDDFDLVGAWTVHMQFQWTQTFTAHATVHIHYEYTPAAGYESAERDIFRLLSDYYEGKVDWVAAIEARDVSKTLTDFCADPTFVRNAERQIVSAGRPENESATPFYWVDYTLTADDKWKQGIGDFTLIVEPDNPDGETGTSQTGDFVMKGWHQLISFCLPDEALGKVETLDGNRLQVHLTGFIPDKDLHIGFFDAPLPKSPASDNKK